MSRQLLPYEQGELDNLCGLYSIVNATRFALRTARFEQTYRCARPRFLSEREAESLFKALVRGVVHTPRLVDTFVDGINSKQLALLLTLADKWLHRRRAMRLFARRPLYRSGRVRSTTVLRLISVHLNTPGSAVIVGANPPWRHWTVATRVSRGRLHLLDSGGSASVPLRLAPQSTRYHAALIKPGEVYFVGIEPACRRGSTPQKARS